MDSFSMDSEGRDRIKEKKKIQGRTRSKENIATAPRQQRQKACWVFLRSQINLQAHRYHCSFHPGVFRGIISTEECVYII
jgi:hypothetical protein